LRLVGLRPTKVSYVNSLLFPPILIVRTIERLRRGNRPPTPHKDTGEVPLPLNKVLIWLLEVEQRIIERGGLPFGVSIVASATTPRA
jgi:hypothetical protein